MARRINPLVVIASATVAVVLIAAVHQAVGAPLGPGWGAELWYWSKVLAGWTLFGAPLAARARPSPPTLSIVESPLHNQITGDSPPRAITDARDSE